MLKYYSVSTLLTFSVIIRSTHCFPVRGSVHLSRILCFPPFKLKVRILQRVTINVKAYVNESKDSGLYLGRMFHSDHYFCGITRHQVHRSAHALHHFTLRQTHGTCQTKQVKTYDMFISDDTIKYSMKIVLESSSWPDLHTWKPALLPAWSDQCDH